MWLYPKHILCENGPSSLGNGDNCKGPLGTFLASHLQEKQSCGSKHRLERGSGPGSALSLLAKQVEWSMSLNTPVLLFSSIA